MTGRGERVLFVTLSNIGDAILTTPVLQLLNQHYPDATIDIIGDARSAIIFKHCPYRGDIYHKQKHKLLHGTLSLLYDMRGKHYAVLVDLRTDVLTYLIRAREKFTKKDSPHLTHAVEKHFAAVSEISNGRACPAPTLWLGDTDEVYARGFCRTLPGARWLCVGPGGNSDKKIWPAENYSSLLNRLVADFDAIVLLGNDQDSRHAQQIAATITLPCFNLCGRTSILQAAAVISKAALFIGNDSGLGHIASAVKTPSFTLFGPGEPGRYHPWGELAGWCVAPSEDIAKLSVDEVKEKITNHLMVTDRYK